MPAQAARIAPAKKTRARIKRTLLFMPPGLYCLFPWSEIK